MRKYDVNEKDGMGGSGIIVEWGWGPKGKEAVAVRFTAVADKMLSISD